MNHLDCQKSYFSSKPLWKSVFGSQSAIRQCNGGVSRALDYLIIVKYGVIVEGRKKNLEKNAHDEITEQGQVRSADSVYITGRFGLVFFLKILNALHIIKEYRAGFFWEIEINALCIY